LAPRKTTQKRILCKGQLLVGERFWAYGGKTKTTKKKGIPKNDYLEAYPFTVATLNKGEVLGLRGKTKTTKQNQKASQKTIT
jgi:hypothetical protein